jgi:hypothetical protein
MERARGGRRFAVLGLIAGAVVLVAGEAFAEVEFGAPPPAPGQATPEAQPEQAPPEAAPIQAQIAALGSVDVQARVAAVRALGDLRDPAAVAPLAEALRSDPSADVRGWILRALGQINTPEARAAIIGAAANDADPRVRALAAQIVPTATTPTFPTPAPTYQAPMYEPTTQQQAARPPRDRNRTLRVAGWSIFGGSYGTAFLLGAVFMMFDPEVSWALMLPLVGPIVEAGFVFADGDEELIVLGIMGFLSAFTQIAGFTMAIVGHVRGRRAEREQEGQDRGVALLPTGNGLALAGWF